MKIQEVFKKLGETISVNAVVAYSNFVKAVNDHNRMSKCELDILSISSAAFTRAFNDVARRICETRTAEAAETYCALANEAVQMLLKGESEANVIWHFEKMYIGERGIKE